MPLNFRGVIPEEREKVISSFDFIDIAKEVALEPFYPSQNFNSSSNEYSLENQTGFRSGRNSTYGITVSTPPTRIIDLTFETKIDAPFTISGDILVNIPMKINATSANDYQMEGFISGGMVISGSSTLTTIDENKLSQTLTAVNTNVESKMAIKLNTSKALKIRRGDYLKFTIEGWGAISITGAGRTGEMWIGHDPSNSGSNGNANEDEFNKIGSRATIFLPIKLQL